MRGGTVIRIQPIGARTPMTPTDRCTATGKLRFATRWDAELALVEWERQNSWHGRTYQCEHCGDHHLTRTR